MSNLPENLKVGKQWVENWISEVNAGRTSLNGFQDAVNALLGGVFETGYDTGYEEGQSSAEADQAFAADLEDEDSATFEDYCQKPTVDTGVTPCSFHAALHARGWKVSLQLATTVVYFHNSCSEDTWERYRDQAKLELGPDYLAEMSRLEEVYQALLPYDVRHTEAEKYHPRREVWT